MYNNIEDKPLISVVIPTRNRIKYVKSAITSILSIKDSRIELVIQDNSDSNELLLWINNNAFDNRLKYHYSDLPLSFVGNFSKGVEASNGEYICIIGDDDGINPEIINATAWLKQENIDCLSIKISANFVWGDAEVPKTLFTNVTGGVLSISKFNGKIIETNPKIELINFIKGGLINYLDYNLPKIYHGIVRAECLYEIKQKTGTYFGGLSPDIYASISLACVVNRIFVTDYPLTISGVCGVSASIVEGLLRKNSKELENAPHFRHRGNYKWSELIPRVYCVETIWADSAISAMKSMNRDDLLQYIDIPKFSAACINANKGITNQVLFSMKNVSKLKGDNYFKNYILFFWYLMFIKLSYIHRFYNRIRVRLLIIIGVKQFQRIIGLNNINDATLALTDYLSSKRIFFKGN